MSEGRKRSIIKPLGPGGEAQGQGASGNHLPGGEFFEPRESLLKRKIYIPIPMIIVGFIGIILMSFSATYLAIQWGVDDLELPENQRLAAFREAAPGTVLETRSPPEGRALAVPFPEASVDVASYRLSPPEVRLSAEVLDIRTFGPKSANPASPPQARLLALETPARAPATVAQIPIPRERRGADSFTSPEGLGSPLADLEVGSFRQVFDLPGPEQLSQNLMARRFANSPSTPGLADEAAGRVFSLPARSAEGLVQVPPERIEPLNQIPLQAGPPAADLEIPSFRQAFNVPVEQNLDQNLMQRRFANPAAAPSPSAEADPLTISAGTLSEKNRNFNRPLGAGTPVSDLDLTIEAPEPAGQGPVLSGTEREFSRALGVDDPVANLTLSPQTLPQYQGQGEPLDQRLMPRRYAKVTAVPEQIVIETAPETPPAPLLEGETLTGDNSLEPWRRFAAAVPPDIVGKGRIVIIIDDMGNNAPMAARLAALDGPLNFAFLPYAPNLERQTSLMRKEGHELLVHMPMEPQGDENPGPRALTTRLNDQELADLLEWNLTRFEGFVGVNNHMGSRFTADRRRMDIVMKSLKERGLLFLDSVTTRDSKGGDLAETYDIPRAARDIFLDNEVNEAAILAQLEKAEELARRRGLAIAIGHPHAATYRALQKWIPTLKSKGLVLVPLSSVVRQGRGAKLAGGG